MTEPAAHPWRRLLGIVYEGMLVAGVLFLANAVFAALTSTPTRATLQGLALLVLAAYFTGLWSGGRRTLAMQTLGLRITTREGAPLTAGRALARFTCALGLFVAALAAGRLAHPLLYGLVAAPWLWSLADRDRRAL